jgi:hypothetical protein
MVPHENALKLLENGTISCREEQMDWDDEFDSGYDGIGDSSQQHGIIDEKRNNCDFDPMDVANPISAYFFLSDDAQDEISVRKRNTIICRSCGLRF